MNNRFRTNMPKLLAIGLVLPMLAMACQVVIPDLSQQAVFPEVMVEPVATALAIPVNTTINVPDDNQIDELNLVDLYSAVNPAVVNITVFTESDGFLLPEGQGSGFVIDEEGDIVTNAHVVHGSEEVEVTFYDGSTFTAEVLGEDLNSDLAVVKVAKLPEGITPLTLGDMDDLAVGQAVVAIGNPFGLEGTLTLGIISALGRTIPALTPYSIPQSIQTDAAINPGNSGGPLLNMDGEVIGVNAQIETDGTSRSNLGVGFAIPVSIVKNVVPELIADGAYEWAWFGVRGGNVTPALVEAMGLDMNKGAYIADVLSNGPAAAAGLEGAEGVETVRRRQVEVGGDIIIAIDGIPVNTFDDLLIYIALKAVPGQDVIVTVLRDGETIEIPITLEERPTSP
jgi:2-alkenal reductase